MKVVEFKDKITTGDNVTLTTEGITMKYIVAFFHSCYLSCIAFFGGTLKNKDYKLLWVIHVHSKLKPFHVVNCNFYAVRRLNSCFCFHAKKTIKGAAK